MQKYFVVYFYKKYKNNFGIGNTFLELSHAIENEDAMREVERVIKEKNHFESCCVINYFKRDAANV